MKILYITNRNISMHFGLVLCDTEATIAIFDTTVIPEMQFRCRSALASLRL